MFFRFVLGSFYLMAQYRSGLFRGVALPLAVYVLLQLMRAVISHGGLSPSAGSAYFSLLASLLFFVADVAVLSVALVNAQRVVFFGETPKAFEPRFGARERQCFLFVVGFLALWIVPGLLISAATELARYAVVLWAVPVGLFLTALFWMLRVTLIFVGAALDKNISLRDSWRMTGDHQWALFLAVATVFGLVLALQFGLDLALRWAGGEVLSLVSFVLITPLLDVFMYVFMAMVLMVLYADVRQVDVSQ